MPETVKTARFEVSGIDCANCALDIEQEIQKRDGLKNTVLDFAGGTI